ncbi:MAG: leucyl aminopeptidase [Spirochaetia bacterium]|nr:leucyl aminopeptidase [Spirochaetia bacterium]
MIGMKGESMEGQFHVPEPRITFAADSAKAKKDDILVIPVFSDQNAAAIAKAVDRPDLKKVIAPHMEAGAFRGGPLEIFQLLPEGVILAGLGKKKAFHPDRMAALFRGLSGKLVRLNGKHILVHFSSEIGSALDSLLDHSRAHDEDPAGIGADSSDEEESPPDYIPETTADDVIAQSAACLLIGADAMDLLKKERNKPSKKPGKPPVVSMRWDGVSKERAFKAVTEGASLGRYVNMVRYVSSLPGNYFHPGHFENYARKIAREHRLEINVFHEAALRKMGCGGIIAVGQGSVNPPRMIVVHHKPAKAPKKGAAPLVLVGKGITFDTGGISLKPPAEMHEMKFDMCGAGLVLHAVAMAKAMNVNQEVIGLLGIAENMPDGNAIKPGDVYTAYNGLTVEVQNTDAEGRLVLGDVLSYACEKYKPRYLLDFATLTGACIIALGHEAAGVMTASEDLAARIDRASRRSLDRSWRLPHWYQYGMGFKSDVSDLRNVAGREAGTISAMRFLSRFVKPNVRWAHFDIAGVAWRGRPSGTQSKGATGWGVRFLHYFLKGIAEGGKG